MLAPLSVVSNAAAAAYTKHWSSSDDVAASAALQVARKYVEVAYWYQRAAEFQQRGLPILAEGCRDAAVRAASTGPDKERG